MKIFRFLFSGTFMGILLVVFAISMGWATFIENDFDTSTAKVVVYNAWWFEAIMALMIVNFSGMIFTRQLYRRSKWNILIMHIAFMIIILGAAITRYIGFEGYMHLRNGQTSNEIISTDSYVNLSITNQEEKQRIYDKLILTPIRKNLYKKETNINGKDVTFEITRFIPEATPVLEESESGVPILYVVAASPSGRIDVMIKENEVQTLGNINISFGAETSSNNIQVIRTGDSLSFKSPFPIRHVEMSTGFEDTLDANVLHPIDFMKIYGIQDLRIVFRKIVEKGVIKYVPLADDSKKQNDIAELKITVDGETRNVTSDAGQGHVGDLQHFNVGDVQFNLILGSQIYTLPFSLHLTKFQLDRYPGSQSPSSFASEIVLIDEKAGLEKPYRIFMNNILDYKGYRFFQSQYDTDEKGTVLSVNHDKAGTIVSYLGYFLLFTSLIITLFTKKTRFAWLSQQINELHKERKKLATTILIIIASILIPLSASSQDSDKGVDQIDKDHAASFGKLLVQNRDGRIIPVNTLADRVVVKIYKKSNYNGMSADQVFLGMTVIGKQWQKEPMIKIYDPALQNMLGIEGEYAAFLDFLDERGSYKLKEQINTAYSKSPAKRTKFDKELISSDERVNVSFSAFNGNYLKVFPLPGHPDNKWGTLTEYVDYMKKKDSAMVNIGLVSYFRNIKDAIETGDYSKADKSLEAMKKYQQEYGSELIPSTRRTNMEVLYNKVNIFKKLFPVYMMLGMILLGIFLLQLFYPSVELKWLLNILYVLLAVAFAAQTIGLAVRWYISGHAPWSNGYESMIYIAWATVLAGFLFRSKSAMTLSVTAILAGITLLTAHMNWLNPEITNLVPVLKSYWLTIHVATITASYGFLALGSMLGFLNLSLMIFRNKNNLERVTLTLKELTFVIEMSLMVGLILLVIGNFLGGIWANESWGRYWGWDPKETWSLITIIVYSFILHTRLVPGLKSLYSTNFMALVGFGSVLMTYFGVNYYLSGLHSYAQGDPVPIPTFVYYLLFIIASVSIAAAVNDMVLKNQKIKA
ncbi:cytochrome c biogenesis protein CcsA [Bacteroidota bacterium]